MGDRWKLKPDKEMMDYLEKADRSGCIPERFNVDEAGNVETQPAKPKTGFDAKDYLNAFSEWNERKTELWGQNGLDVGKAYDMTKEFGPLPKTQEEIQALLDLIPEENASPAGVFISYLVNEVYQYDKIELKISKPFCHLGICNEKKKWKIVGDTGDHTGGGFSGGEMTVYGNTGRGTGVYMKGGKIAVNGNVGGSVGECMTSGEIHLNGDYESLGDLKGGSIYHNGHNLSRLRAQTRSGTLPSG